MTDRAHPITDDLLHAYVDGFLDEPARRDVERHLAQHADAAERVRAWQAINEGLERLGSSLSGRPGRTFDWKHGGGSEQDQLAARRAGRRPSTRMFQAAAVAASLAIGMAGGWYARDRQESRTDSQVAALAQLTFVKQAAVAYKVFAAPHQARPVEITGEERERLQRWLSGKMGLNFAMRVPQLEALGWALIGGRMLSDAKGPAALYVYEDEQKNRLALYVVALGEDAKIGLTWTPGPTALIADWGYDRLHMALAGQVDQAKLKALLGPINQQIVADSNLSPADLRVARLPDPPLALGLNPHR